jgi:hypothetical protein
MDQAQHVLGRIDTPSWMPFYGMVSAVKDVLNQSGHVGGVSETMISALATAIATNKSGEPFRERRSITTQDLDAVIVAFQADLRILLGETV